MSKGINPYASKSGHTATPEAAGPALEPVPSGTAAEILEWVGDDSERAERALEIEKDKHKRKTLIRELEKVVDA